MTGIGAFLKELKRLSTKGRCLHFDSGERCSNIINAHSIQEKGLLKKIAHEGHVYRISADVGTLGINNGKLDAKKIGIKKVSTFVGFCEKHDNALFEPIDNASLIPTDEQIFLYAYRSLCRELFVKENSFTLIDSQIKNESFSPEIKSFLSNVKAGTEYGLKSLRFHKRRFDNSLGNSIHHDIRYVVFLTNDPPIVFFSGLLYPDFDFLGAPIQDLGNKGKIWDLITFCSAPIASGWAFIFAWHKSSTQICLRYMRTLATYVHDNESISDTLFRYIFSCCENHAISPIWWENLGKDEKRLILERADYMADSTKPVFPEYLREGLEGISNWNFSNVISKTE